MLTVDTLLDELTAIQNEQARLNTRKRKIKPVAKAFNNFQRAVLRYNRMCHKSNNARDYVVNPAIARNLDDNWVDDVVD